MSHPLPLFFSESLSEVLLVGASDAAARKYEWLKRCGATVTVVGSPLCKFLDDEVSQGNAQWHPSADALPTGLSWRFAVVVETDASRANDLASALRARGTLVNVLNAPENSDFVLPSIIDREPVIVAVSTGGVMPAIARWVRSRLETALPARLGALALMAARWRGPLRQRVPAVSGRQAFWERMLDGRFADLVLSGDEDSATRLIEQEVAGVRAPAGEVFLVGAGPGDPELLTMRAFRLIRAADVVLYDRLVSPDILRLCRSDAEKIHVGKARANHSVPQDQINALLVEYAQQGKRVLRLKGGDPFIFGRGGEELESIVEAGIPFQVVPGVTAAAGCAAYAGIPLTHRDYAQSVRFVTGHLKDGTTDLPWHELIHPGQTLVFYMGLVGLTEICRQLVGHGMAPTTPVALVSRGTTPDQHVVTGSLVTISDRVDAERVRAPTLIIVGDVVSLRDKLDWRSRDHSTASPS